MKLEGCTDGGCIFGHPGGMHTNGGCACVSTLMVLPHDDRRRFQRNIKALRERVTVLEGFIAQLRGARTAIGCDELNCGASNEIVIGDVIEECMDVDPWPDQSGEEKP